MDSILLQKQIRDNAEDLKSYLQDLKSWESEMKRKEAEIHSSGSGSQLHPPVRSKMKKLSKEQKKCGNQKEKPSKISGFDYASWDKFDMDKACEDLGSEQIDPEEDVEGFLSEIEEERKREEAVYEKERGNDFVKKQKWKEAIQCYSRAIKCYPSDAIFYANRALCYLKIEELKSAEADATTALQLDPNYVKAYQRRAMARAGLNQLTEARADLLKVLEIEPKNMASKTELAKIEKKINMKTGVKVPDRQSGSAIPESKPAKSQELKSSKKLDCKAEKLTYEKESKKSSIVDIGEIKAPSASSEKDPSEIMLENSATSSSASNNIIEQKYDTSRLTENKSKLWPSDDMVKLVKPIKKAPHLRSKKPLRRITIEEVENPISIEGKTVNSGEIKDKSLNINSEIQESSDKTISVVVKEDDKHINHADAETKNIPPSAKVISENQESSNKTTSVIVKEEDKHINNADAKTKNAPPPAKVTLNPQSTFDKDTLTKNVTSFKVNVEDTLNEIPPVPSTSVQFYVGWKKVKSNPQLSYLYLKQIPGSELARLFGDSLESSMFSDIISTLETCFIQSKEQLLPYMKGLTKVRRFGALIMFLSQADKAGIRNMLHYCKEQGECSHEEFTDLLKKYEL